MYIGEQKEKLIKSKDVLGYFKKGKEKILYKIFVEQGMKDKYKKEL